MEPDRTNAPAPAPGAAPWNAPPAAGPPGEELPEDRLARPMFFLALLHLLLLAGLFHRLVYAGTTGLERTLITSGLLALWPVFAAEALVRVWQAGAGCRRREALRALLLVVLPPFRMGTPSLVRRGQVWLPALGWRDLDKRLQEDLDRRFAVPMILFALMVVPLLVLELAKSGQMESHPWLRLVLQAGIAFIWVAFALEFILKVSVAPHALRYIRRQWIDVAIVVIPTLEFLLSHVADAALAGRLARLSRLVSPQYVARMSQLYRMRGLIARAWAAFMVLGVVSRLLGKDPDEIRLRKLRAELEEKEEELAELRHHIAELEARLAARAAAVGAEPVGDGQAGAGC